MAIIIETCPKCGHDLHDVMIATYPPIPKKECWNCGWSWTGEPEEIVRMPFGGNSMNTETINYLDYSHINSYKQSPCDGCSNSPKNGGSGICHCILGQMNVVY